tara:strand:- start:5374 stop:5499 length:126 start_codon:yes stop_codon:yes gene_type:complete
LKIKIKKIIFFKTFFFKKKVKKKYFFFQISFSKKHGVVSPK